jgi:hypothetical protein
MSYNVFTRLKKLFPTAPLQIGEVTAVETGSVTVALPDGGVLTARGSASVGQNVYVRDGVVEGVAPDLPTLAIEV